MLWQVMDYEARPDGTQVLIEQDKATRCVKKTVKGGNRFSTKYITPDGREHATESAMLDALCRVRP